MLSNEDDDDDDDTLDEIINENLKTMKDIYKSSNKLGQLVILSLASQQYSKFNIRIILNVPSAK